MFPKYLSCFGNGKTGSGYHIIGYDKTPSIGIEGVLFIVRFNLPISRFPLSTEADLHGFRPRAPQNADAVR